MSKEDNSSVEKLRRRLYNRQEDESINADVRTPLSKDRSDAPVAWTPAKPPEPISTPLRPADFAPKNKLSFAGKFLLASAFFFFWAAAIAAYVFFGGGNLISSQNINLQIVAPSLVDGGKDATLQILIDNRNTAELQAVDLLIDYPEGTRDPKDPSKPLLHERQSIGNIAPGTELKRTITGIFFGQEGTEQKVKITLQYALSGSNAVFEKEAETSFLVGSSPVSLSVKAPSEAISGEQFEVVVTVQSNATEPVPNVVVQGQYPFGFSPSRSQPAAASGGSLWRLGTMNPGSTQTIHLFGSIDGQDGDERVFRFLVGSNADKTDSQVKVPFLTVPVAMTLHKPFISGAITIDGKTGKIVSVTPGKTVQGIVTWQNNSSDAVSDVQLSLALDGPMLDKNSVQVANGFYQSSNSTIVWTKDQFPELASVPPGGTATLQFSFATLQPGSGGTLYSNPTINLKLTVNGVRVGEGNVPQQVTSAATTQVTLASALALSARAQHFTGAFTNSGPMPPKAEQDTTYTVQWTVKNSSNAIANATVSTVLPPYVDYVKGESGVGYDSGSRTVTWSLGDLKAGVGYSLPDRNVSFQVKLRPSLSQVNTSPALTGSATFNGQDRFAQVPVQSSTDGPTTSLSGESGYSNGMGVISQ
ncbi:hypothetical protein KW798_02360 [Candidatus Parcubacteria bacterium]|nr:hypothetical protein [Candidatus Parcubacteria bacterium]